MVSSDPRHVTGREGEEAAVAFLRGLGWRVLERNWRQGPLELDVVARDRATLIFVEVRTRKAGAKVSPAESFGPAKARTFLKAVQAYLAAHNGWDHPCRCDLVCVTRNGQQLDVEHHQHVIELGATVDRGHASWQPW